MGFDEVERSEIEEFWEEKFGVPPSVFDGYGFYMKGRNKVWIASSEPGDFEHESVGLPFLRVNQEHPKPTTDALQRFGEHATRNVVEVGVDDAREFVAGGTVERGFDVDLGYVVVEHDGDVLGCGLYFPDELRSQVPKGRRVEVVV